MMAPAAKSEDLLMMGHPEMRNRVLICQTDVGTLMKLAILNP